MLGVAPSVGNLGDDRGGGRSDLLGPSRESLGRPLLGESAVSLRHVFGHSEVDVTTDCDDDVPGIVEPSFGVVDDTAFGCPG